MIELTEQQQTLQNAAENFQKKYQLIKNLNLEETKPSDLSTLAQSNFVNLLSKKPSFTIAMGYFERYYNTNNSAKSQPIPPKWIFYSILAESLSYYFIGCEDIAPLISISNERQKDKIFSQMTNLRRTIRCNSNLAFRYSNLIAELDKALSTKQHFSSGLKISPQSRNPEITLFIIMFTKEWRSRGAFINAHALSVYKSGGSSNPLSVSRPHCKIIHHLCSMLMSMPINMQKTHEKSEISEGTIRTIIEQEEAAYPDDLIHRLRTESPILN